MLPGNAAKWGSLALEGSCIVRMASFVLSRHLKRLKGLDSHADQNYAFRAEQSRAEQSRAEQSRAEQSRAEQGTGEAVAAPFFAAAGHLKLNASFEMDNRRI